MFEQLDRQGDVAVLRGLIATLGELDQGVDDGVRIDRIRTLEELKSAAAAAQARETAAFAVSQRAAQRAAGVPSDRVGRGIAGQVGLTRRISPFHAARYVGWASILTRELPQTFAALAAGRTSEWRALIVARETVFLSRANRARVDTELAPQLEQLGDRRVEAEAKKIGYRLDPHGFVDRVRGAEQDRHVGLRPAPDAMGRLTILAPVAQTVAAHVALGREADRLRNAGDPRSRGQLMADTALTRLTGQATAADVPVEIQLVMSDQTLLDPHSPEPAHLTGYGPIPAGIARSLALHGTAPRWLRRLFRQPATGELAALETRRRLFTASQRQFLTARDQYCRTPWCAAPIRHADHITPAEHGGCTNVTNGQGYCAACNHGKQAFGWHTRTLALDGGHRVEITTPTGHRYQSRAPDPPGTNQTPRERHLEQWLNKALRVAA